MEIQTRDIGQFKVLDVSGEIDRENAKVFETAINFQVDQGSFFLAINLGGVSYLNSGSLNVIVRTWQRLAHLNGALSAISPRPEITGYLRATSMDTIMPVYKSEKSFVSDISRRRPQSRPFTVRDRGRFKVVDVTRPISVVSGYKELEKEMDEIIQKGHRFVAFKFHSRAHIYSELIGSLTKWGWLLTRVGGRLHMIGPSAEVRERLSIMGMDRHVVFSESEQDLETRGIVGDEPRPTV